MRRGQEDLGVFSVSGFFWPERSSDDAEALLSLASSNLKYAMTVGWEDGMFYYVLLA